MSARKIRLVALLGALATSLFSQAPINILSVQQGLPRNPIYDIEQDSFGFLWLGTGDGLVKYDGQEVSVFRAAEGSIPFDYAYDLFIDRQHRMWIGCNADYRGAACLDLARERFRHYHQHAYPSLSNNGVVSIGQDQAGRIAMLTKDFELNLLDEEADTFRTWRLSDYLPDPRHIVNVLDIRGDPNEAGLFWISCVDGIFAFDIASESFRDQLFCEGWTPSKFLWDAEDREHLWVGLTSRGGLLRIDLRDRQKTYFGLDTIIEIDGRLSTFGQRPFGISDMAPKTARELYVGSANRGIGIFDKTTGSYDFALHRSTVLETDHVRAIHSNSRGELWAGADRTSLFYLRPDSDQLSVHLFTSQMQDKSEWRMSDVYALSESLYILSFFRGPALWIWDREQDLYDEIAFSHPALYGYDIFDHGGNLYVSSNRGFSSIDIAGKALTPNAIAVPPAVRNVNEVLNDSNGFWSIAWGLGVLHHSDTVILYEGGVDSNGLRHRWTHDLALGPEGELWLGQENGLYKIDPKSQKVTCLAQRGDLGGFNSPNFKALLFDGQGRLWTGNFGGGIACYDPAEEKILTKLDLASGLPSGRIYDMILDDDGFIWTWTSEGLSSFFPAINPGEIQINSYPDTKYLPVSRQGVWFTKMKSGEIFFGVSGGFVHFNPRELRADLTYTIDPPILTAFRVRDQQRPFAKGWGQQAVRLKPRENFFSISFSAPKTGFISPQQFKYRLAGVDQDWVKSGMGRTASYNDVRSGTYQFHVMVGDQNGTWSKPALPLTVIVATPWYDTHVARVGWGLLFVSLLLGINRTLVLRERMRHQLSINKLEADSLRQLDRAKSDFFTRISHEFRTPLSVIQGLARYLRGRSSDRVDQDHLDAIDRNSRHLLHQVNQILDLSKLQNNAIRFRPILADAISYMRYVLDAFSAFAQSRDIELVFTADPDQIIMDFDPPYLKDVIANLVSNAFKFTEEGGIIRVQAARVGLGRLQHLELTVEDNGVGISSEDLPHIFESYYQGSQSYRGTGSGLGLAMVRQWIQMMGGEVTAESQIGQGSLFRILLPITQQAARAEPVRLDAEMPNLMPTDAHKLADVLSAGSATILLVEDHEDVLRYLRLCLPGFQVLQASDGAKGLQMAQEHVPDLIVTDVMMPQLDGYSLTEKLRASHVTNHIPIIMLTAKATQAEKKQGLLAGADAYLTKPFDPEELQIRVQGLLSQRRLLQDKYGIGSMGRGVKPMSHPFLERLEGFVLAHLSESIAVSDLAKEVHMSRVQLYRKVKALTGHSVSVYIRQVRLSEAKAMLDTTDRTVAEISYAAGFTDPSYFTRVFKEAFGHPPSEMRTVHRPR